MFENKEPSAIAVGMSAGLNSMKNSMDTAPKLRIKLHVIQGFLPLLGFYYIDEWSCQLYSQKIFCCSIVNYSQNLETTQMSENMGVVKETVVYIIHSKILFNYKKKWKYETCHYANEIGLYYTEWSESGKRDKITSFIHRIYKPTVRGTTNSQKKQKNISTNLQNKSHQGSEMWGVGWGWWS